MFVVLTAGGRATGSCAPAGASSRSGRRRRARGAEDERRILVIANETVGGEALRETIRQKSEGFASSVLVVVPALNSPLRHWVSDEDRRARRGRASGSSGASRGCASSGSRRAARSATGEPLQAIEDWARHLRPGRDHHLDAPGGPLALAREGRRPRSARALRGPDHARRRRPGGRGRRSVGEPAGSPTGPLLVRCARSRLWASRRASPASARGSARSKTVGCSERSALPWSSAAWPSARSAFTAIRDRERPADADFVLC